MILRNAIGFIVLVLCYATPGLAQNFVPNPGFELYNKCPDNIPVGMAYPEDIKYNLNYDNFPTARDWVSPLRYSETEYFNDCNVLSYDRSIPGNQFGFQFSHTSHAYAGMYMYGQNKDWQDSRSYLESKFIAPFLAGHKYHASFYVSLAASHHFSGNVVAVDQIGLYFSDTMVHDSMYLPNSYLSLAPHIVSVPGNYITDTTNWTKIEGTYTAHGGEQWLTLGHFKDNLPVSNKFLYAVKGEVTLDSPTYCFMYIDDVCVMDITDNTSDTSFCAASFPLTLHGVALQGSYLWNTGDTSSSLTITKPGIYWRQVSGECLFHADTFDVGALPALPVHDTTLCMGEGGITLGSAQGATSYTWSTGYTGCCIYVDDPGTYSLTATNRCGNVKGTVNVSFQLCGSCLIIPSAFTPNNDGRNDVFTVYSRCPLEEYRLNIYNRSGNLVFSSANVNNSWDGTYGGVMQDMGVYFYYIDYTPDMPGKGKEILKGDITLIR